MIRLRVYRSLIILPKKSLWLPEQPREALTNQIIDSLVLAELAIQSRPEVVVLAFYRVEIILLEGVVPHSCPVGMIL